MSEIDHAMTAPVAGYTPMMIVRFQKSFPLRVNEWFLSAVLMLFGLILAQPDEVFSVFPVFRTLAQFAPETTWAILCMGVGAARLAALAINGAWRPSPHIRASLAFLSCFFWLQISLGLIASKINNTGLAVYPMLLALDIYSVFRASQDAGAVDAAAKAYGLSSK